MFFNFFKSRKFKKEKPKTKDSQRICFEDIKGSIFSIQESDEYLSIDIDGNVCYFNRDQLKTLIELCNEYVNGKTVKNITEILDFDTNKKE